MEIYLIRHTRPNVEGGICYGQKDLELPANSQSDINLVLKKLPHQFDLVCSSPLQRCLRLALQLKHGEFKSDPRWKELNFGAWEGVSWEDISREEMDAWGNDYFHQRPPEGENLLELHERVHEALRDLKKQSYRKIALVTHAGVIRSLYCHLMETPLEDYFDLKVKFGDCFKISNVLGQAQWKRI